MLIRAPAQLCSRMGQTLVSLIMSTGKLGTIPSGWMIAGFMIVIPLSLLNKKAFVSGMMMEMKKTMILMVLGLPG